MPIQVGVGVSAEKEPHYAVREAIRQARSRLKTENISFALLFASSKFSSTKTLQIANELLGSVPLVGCSSMAIITGDGIFKNALALALVSLPSAVQFNIGRVSDIGTENIAQAGNSLGTRMLYGFKEIRRDLSLLLSDGTIANGSALIQGFQERMGMSVPLSGGAASSELPGEKTHIFYESEVLSQAACGILWGGKMNFSMGIRHGWQPLGKPRLVTKAHDNVVYEIDGTVAVKFYEEYFGIDLPTLRKQLKMISVLYPIGIHIEGEHEYLLRNITHIGDDGSLVFRGNVPESSSVRLMIGTKESCLEATEEATRDVKMNMHTPIDFLLVFDSVSRYILLGRDAHKELDIIKQRLGTNIPIIGIYTYGEQAPVKAIDYQGRAYLHNQTISLIALGAS